MSAGQNQSPTSAENAPSVVTGDYSSIAFPTSFEPFLEDGLEFLNRAFTAFGILKGGNSVARIVEAREFFAGSAGRKIMLTVAYANDDPNLHTELFMKFPRDFGDPLREYLVPASESEVRFGLLSREFDLPIISPKCYFADIHLASGSTIIITERIAYGRNGIEPAFEKCLDYEVPNLLDRYRLLTTSMGALAASYHGGGAIKEAVDAWFPFDRDAWVVNADPTLTSGKLERQLEKLLDFAHTYPQFLAPDIISSGFLHRFAGDAPMMVEKMKAISSYLNADPKYILFSHYNMNVDNAWFWRDESGKMQAGLLDWGGVGRLNIGQSIYGAIGASEADFLDKHRQELIDLLVDTYRLRSGITLDAKEVARMTNLSVAILGIPWTIDTPGYLLSVIDDLKDIPDRYDPRIKKPHFARQKLQWLNVMLNEWRREDIGGILRKL